MTSVNQSQLIRASVNGAGRRCAFLDLNGDLIVTMDNERPHRVADISGVPEQHELKFLPLGIQEPYLNAGIGVDFTVDGATTGTGSVEPGQYAVCWTWYAPELGIESMPSARKIVTVDAAEDAITFTGELLIPVDLDATALDWVRIIRVYRSLLNNPDITEEVPQETAGNYYRAAEFDFRALLDASSLGNNYPAYPGAGNVVEKGEIYRTTVSSVTYRYIVLATHTTGGSTLGDGTGNDDAGSSHFPASWQLLGGDPIYLDRGDTGTNGIAYAPPLEINRRVPQSWSDCEYHRGLVYYTGSRSEEITVDVTSGSAIIDISNHLNFGGTGNGFRQANSGWVGRRLDLLEGVSGFDISGLGSQPPVGNSYIITHVLNEWQLYVKKLPLEDEWAGYEGTTRRGVRAVVRHIEGEVAWCETDEKSGGAPIPDYVPAGNRLYHRPPRGGRNECLMSSGELCYLLTDHSLSYFTGPLSQIREIHQMRIYTLGKRGVCRDSRGWVWMVGPDGLYVADGTPNPPRNVSWGRVDDWWFGRSHSTWGWNMDRMEQCCMEYDPQRERIFLWGPSRGWAYNNLCLVYDIRTDSFWTLLLWVDGDRTQQVVFSDITWMDVQLINGRQELIMGGSMITPTEAGSQKTHRGRMWIFGWGAIDEVPRDKAGTWLRDHEIHWERTFSPVTDVQSGAVMGAQLVEVHVDPVYAGNEFNFAFYEHPHAGSRQEAADPRGFFIRTEAYHRCSWQEARSIVSPAPNQGLGTEPVVYGFAGEERDLGVIRGIVVHAETYGRGGVS